MKLELRSLCPISMVASMMILSLTACGSLPFLDSSHGAVDACEESLKGNLLSPSSYKRDNAQFRESEFTFDDYYESHGGDECKPYTSGECDDATKFLRAHGVRTWLLAEDDLRSGREILEVFREIENRPFPNVSDQKKWQADRDYLEFLYDRNYGDRRTTKLPAATVTVEYDAANTFNALIRATHVCRFPPTDSDRYSMSSIY